MANKNLSPDKEESSTLEALDAIVRKDSVRRVIDGIVDRTEKRLFDTSEVLMRWESIPLAVYGVPLPAAIRSSWVFILRADAATGAERHPNSRQRMMSYRGSGDLQTRTGKEWDSHHLESNYDLPMEQRWISIPENTWHQAVVAPGPNWAVVSFQTVPADELIEERPDPADDRLTVRKKYLGDMAG